LVNLDKNYSIFGIATFEDYIFLYTYKNGVLTVHCGVEEITVNVRKMLKKFHWTFADLAVFESGT
jgi:hypothetical protein